MVEGLFKLLQLFFKRQPHPFNEGEMGKLNYSEFEYKSAEATFDLYKGYGDFKKLIKGARVLDVGCGGGGKSVWMTRHGASSITGLDAEQIFIDQANNFAKKNKVESRCNFILGDAAKLPFAVDSFDMIILNDVMEHVKKPFEVLLEAHRVLRKGGRVFINMEPYFHPNGSHMMDVFTMPWNQVFFTEKFRIKMYKKMVANLADGNERVRFRISKDENGIERVGYLNHMTIRRFESLLKNVLNRGFEAMYMERRLFSGSLLFFFGHLPFWREFLTRFLVVVLQKQ